MKLLVGLGNIGKEYERTKHNVGFIVIDALAERLGVKFNKRGCEADYGEYNAGGEKFIFAKPRTYMNDSGRAVKSLSKKFDIPAGQILIIVDDIDQPMGDIRLRPSGSAGTHNGLRSIVRELGSEEFLRLRVGIGKQHDGEDLAGYVLSGLSNTDEQKSGLKKAEEAAYEFVLGESFDSLMTKYNGRAEKNGTHKKAF